MEKHGIWKMMFTSIYILAESGITQIQKLLHLESSRQLGIVEPFICWIFCCWLWSVPSIYIQCTHNLCEKLYAAFLRNKKFWIWNLPSKVVNFFKVLSLACIFAFLQIISCKNRQVHGKVLISICPTMFFQREQHQWTNTLKL